MKPFAIADHWWADATQIAELSLLSSGHLMIIYKSGAVSQSTEANWNTDYFDGVRERWLQTLATPETGIYR